MTEIHTTNTGLEFVRTPDSCFDEIADFPFPYSQFQYGRFGRVTLKTAPTKVPAEFVICVGFNATATKGVFMHYDSSTHGNDTLVHSS